jgi:hypothetical protein
VRRRFLKVVAGAAPMVMTLPVGAQTAGASILCSAKPVTPAPPNVITGADGFVRKSVEVWIYRIQRPGAGAPFDLKVWKIVANFYSAEDSNGYSVGTPVPIPGDNVQSTTLQPQQESLLYYVTPDGISAQAYPLASGGNPLSTSCWTSLPGVTLFSQG